MSVEIVSFRSCSGIEEYCAKIQSQIDAVEKKIESAGEVSSEEIARRYLSFGSTCGSQEITCSLNILKFENPAVHADKGVQDCHSRIKAIFKKYGAFFSVPKNAEVYKVYRPMDTFHGDQLVIGCGHAVNEAVKQCAGHSAETTYLISQDKTIKPDMKADFYSSAFWKEFSDASFREVFVEGWSPEFSENSFKEMARILRPGGIARLVDNSSYKDVDVEALGFQKSEVVAETYFSCGRMREFSMLHLYK